MQPRVQGIGLGTRDERLFSLLEVGVLDFVYLDYRFAAIERLRSICCVCILFRSFLSASSLLYPSLVIKSLYLPVSGQFLGTSSSLGPSLAAF